MRSGWFIVPCTFLATFFPYFPVFGEMDVTGLWVLEIKSHSTTTETEMVEISKVKNNYEINPDDGEWEVAPIEDFQVKDDVITFKMGGIVSCKLTPKENIWSGKCMEVPENNANESFSVILRLPDKPSSDASSKKEKENKAEQKQ